jgi:hypothetical protein
MFLRRCHRRKYDEPGDDEKIPVRLNDIKFERLRDFGDVWPAYGLWRLLGPDKVLAECIHERSIERIEMALNKLKSSIDITKDELSIRPIWHHKARRVEAHILVCFLAYVMWKTLGQWMKRSGLGDAPRTLLQEFAKIKSGDVVLPAKTADGRISKLIRLRCVVSPGEAQKVLLNRLGLTLPQRLRRLEKIAKCSEDF